jgi:hypothetical protein
MLRSAGPAAALALLGCIPSSPREHACTDVGCGYAFQVQFSHPGGWAAGTYRVEVTADGISSACDIDMPLVCDRPPRCTGTPDWLPTLSGCALPPAQHGIEGVFFSRRTPATVDVAVRQADRSLGTAHFTPVYTTGQPNGSDCEPTCRQANRAETLVLSP